MNNTSTLEGELFLWNSSSLLLLSFPHSLHSPKYVSCTGMNCCISDTNFAISCESFVILQSSSEWKSGLICLHRRSWLITFPRLLGPTADESMENVRNVIYYSINFIFWYFNVSLATKTKLLLLLREQSRNFWDKISSSLLWLTCWGG